MNANPEILNLPAPDSAPAPQSSAAPQLRPGRTRHRRTGKVANLPKVTRDKVNSGLDDGVPYEKIIESLGPEGAGLTIHNISEWKTGGGYQDYLDDKFWREDMSARKETFTELLAGADAIKLPEGGLQLAATGACELLRDLCDLSTGADGKVNPDQYVRVANSLARLSRSILTLQQYRDTAAKAKSLELQRLDTDRDFAEADRTVILDRADDLFGFKGHHRLPAQPQVAMVPVPVDAAVAPATLEPPLPDTGGPPQSVSPPEEPPASKPVPGADATVQRQDSGISAPPPGPPGPAQTPGEPESSAAPPALPQMSKSPGRCSACNIVLPPLLKNGERSIPCCPKCGNGVDPPPAWNPFDCPPPNANPSACDVCRQRHKLDPNGLPDPCPECGLYHLAHPEPVNPSS